MKKLLYAFFLTSLVVFATSAAEFEIKDLGGGMWSNASSNRIPDNASELIQNFYTDVETIAIERNGYEKRDSTELGGTEKVSGLWEFVDTSGAQWIISFSSRTFYRNEIGGTPTAFGLVSTVDTIPEAAINLGRIWFVNGTDDLWWFDGTSTGNVTSVPLGEIIVAWRERIAIGKIGAARSTVRFSADGDGENYTLGGNPTDPFALSIGGGDDGFPVTCMWSSYIDNLIIARKRDLWALSGFDQADIELRQINSEIGCIQGRSMREFDGSLIFMSNRGLEEMRGITIEHISEPIRDITDHIVKSIQNERSLVKTTASDWDAGTTETTIYIDTESANGSIVVPFPDDFDTFRTGDDSTKQVWISTIQGTGSQTDLITVLNSNLRLRMSATGSGQAIVRTATTTHDLSITGGTTFFFDIDGITNSGASDNFAKFHFTLTTVPIGVPCCDAGTQLETGTHWSIIFVSTPLFPIFVESNSSDVAIDAFQQTGLSDPVEFAFFIDSSNYQYTIGASSIIKRGTHAWSNPRVFVNLVLDLTSLDTGNPFTADIGNFNIVPQTFTYISPVFDVGTEIAAWGLALIEESASSGVSSYEFNSSANSDINLFDSTAWTSIVSGEIPTNSTQPFAAFRTAVAITTPTQNYSLDLLGIAWTEGTLIQPIVSWNHDRRYWLAYTTNTSAGATNDRVIIYQRNRTFSLLNGINALSFATWRNDLYFGNSDSTGFVYKFDAGNNDDGSDIESKIIFKSYDLGTWNQDKDFRNLYVNFLGGSSGSLSLTYDLDRSGNVFSLGSALMTEGVGQVAAKFPFPLSNPVQGREIQYTLTKSGTGDRLKLYDLKTQFSILEAR